MLVKSIAALAALTLAANVAAEPMPYKPSMMRTSTRDLFGVVRRQDDSGYQPDQEQCSEGNTCAEACGAGYEVCTSKDKLTHCYNPTVGEICCPDQNGGSCEQGYYCTADKKGETWCCPDGMDVEACAAAYDLTGGLVSQTPPPPPPTSTSTKISSTKPPRTSSTSHSTQRNSTTSNPVTSSTSFLPSSSSVQVNSTSVSTVSSPQPTQTNAEEEGAGSVVGPASALVFLAAGIAALL
ncbi:hypothetical protein C7999DRAFT_34413 [Corynascus novoguineensis]|uniref:Uncharacterized protein n=1 Tax=Corynascus novoguineensis TaxID=1126955 RepID=A0AAN7CN75_9PEZI|nr:hypothetical protein C7999DRAFT_34413 [Corynascus novoguineensis]